MPDKIWLVWARRGDYSDRTEYAVCWFPTQQEAERAAREMQIKSDDYRSRNPRCFDDTKTQTDIGDSYWSSWDHTTYAAVDLERGKMTP